MTPTDDELAVAIDAAAERAYNLTSDARDPWPTLEEPNRLRYRDLVRPLIEAALEALPDRSAAARREVLERLADRVCTCVRTDGSHWPGCAAAILDEALG